MNTNLHFALKPVRALGRRALSLCAGAWLAAASLLTSQAQTPPLIAGFEGIVSGWTPADPIIAAGPNSLVTMVSGGIATFNKQGVKLFEQNLGAGGFWAAQGGDQVAEPWVIFDPHSSRFIAIAREVGTGKGNLYLAVSKGPAPLASTDWHKYLLDFKVPHVNGSGEFTYPDYPKVGVNSGAICITANQYGINSLQYSHAQILALEKSPLLLGNPANELYYEELPLPHFSIHPAVVYDPTPLMYCVKAGGVNDKITVHVLDFAAVTRTETLVPVSTYFNPPGVPQLGTSALLESLDRRIMSGVVRNGSLWTAHAIQDPAVDNEAVVRWYQFDITGAPILVQSGNVDPGPGIHTFLPHVNVDANNNLGLVFSVGSATNYAAIGYTGRMADDPAGTTLPVQIARSGSGAYTQAGWGEHSGLAIDPDGRTFWLFHQYPTGQRRQQWKTFGGAFQLDPPAPANPLHVGDLDGSATATSKNWKATVVVTIHDGNDNVVSGATVSAQWTGGFSGSATLTTDANGRCTFISGNMSKTSPSATLTIVNVTHPPLIYNADLNHDSNGNSNGTSIVINKP